MRDEEEATNAPPKFMSDAPGGQCIDATDVAVENPTRAPSVSAPYTRLYPFKLK